MDRLPLLLASYERNKQDPFIQYAIALEYLNGGDTDQALTFFEQVHESFPEYLPNYFHYAKLLGTLERTEEALTIADEGLEKTQVKDPHAHRELRGLKDMIEDGLIL